MSSPPTPGAPDIGSEGLHDGLLADLPAVRKQHPRDPSRLLKGRSCEAIARHAGLSGPYVWRVLHGYKQGISLTAAVAIANALGCSPGELAKHLGHWVYR